jgi:DNA-binding SARP family transcriptional activator
MAYELPRDLDSAGWRACVPRAKLSLLGGFRLEPAVTVRELPASAQRLLAFLAIRGPTSRAAVAGTLWPAAADGRALASLRTAIWRLNQCDQGLVTTVGDRLALSAAVDVDLHALRSGALRLLSTGPVRDGDLELSPLTCAELLPGWYEDWVLFERERLRQLWLHALESLSGLLVQRNRYAEALEAALEAVRSEPLRESANRAAIAVHLAEGNVVEALRHYQRFHQLIASELQVEPSERLAAMVAPWVPAARRAPGSAMAMSVAAARPDRPVRAAVVPQQV